MHLSSNAQRSLVALAIAGWLLATAGSPIVASAEEIDLVSATPVAVPAATNAVPHDHGIPDRAAEYVGGAAIRMRTHEGGELPGNLFMLIAADGSTVPARVFDENRYELNRPEIHPESVQSNVEAVAAVEQLTGEQVNLVDFVSPPGGGASTGLTYTVAYLDMLSEGGFTDGLRVATTGSLRDDGYLFPIKAVDEKVAAAHLAGIDVVFASSAPTAETIESHAGRFEGELSRARNTGASLEEERRWAIYEAWGADRSIGRMDVIGVRHVGDVAAYLCGAGSAKACRVRLLLSDVVNDSSPADPSPVTAYPSDRGCGSHQRVCMA